MLQSALEVTECSLSFQEVYDLNLMSLTKMKAGKRWAMQRPSRG